MIFAPPNGVLEALAPAAPVPNTNPDCAGGTVIPAKAEGVEVPSAPDNSFFALRWKRELRISTVIDCNQANSSDISVTRAGLVRGNIRLRVGRSNTSIIERQILNASHFCTVRDSPFSSRYGRYTDGNVSKSHACTATPIVEDCAIFSPKFWIDCCPPSSLNDIGGVSRPLIIVMYSLWHIKYRGLDPPRLWIGAHKLFG